MSPLHPPGPQRAAPRGPRAAARRPAHRRPAAAGRARTCPPTRRCSRCSTCACGSGRCCCPAARAAEETTADDAAAGRAPAGCPTVDVDITFTSITMCCHRGMAAAPVTSMRLVRYRTTRPHPAGRGRPDRASGWSGSGWTCDAAAAALAEAVGAPHPYPRWVATVGLGRAGRRRSRCCSAAPPVTALAAFVVTALIDRLGRLLGPVGVAAVLPAGGRRAGRHRCHARRCSPPACCRRAPEPSLVVAASITVLLSGLSVVGTVQDAISSYYVTAAGPGRGDRAAVRGPADRCRARAEDRVRVRAHARGRPSRWPPTPASSASRRSRRPPRPAMFALAGYAPLRSLLAAGLAGAAGWAIYGALTQFADVRAGGGHRRRGHRGRAGHRPAAPRRRGALRTWSPWPASPRCCPG